MPSYFGISITFKTADGSTGIYDFSGVANIDHAITIQNQVNRTILTLTLSNIYVGASSQTIIDPIYDLAASPNYNLRYDGAGASDDLTYGALTATDLDGNGKMDLLVGASYVDNNSRTDSGSLYIIYDSLLDDYTNTGNTIDLANPSNYNLRYDGADIGDIFTHSALISVDLNGNGKSDLLAGANYADNNSRTDSGSLYIIYDSLIDDYTGTGNNIRFSHHFQLQSKIRRSRL